VQKEISGQEKFMKLWNSLNIYKFYLRKFLFARPAFWFFNNCMDKIAFFKNSCSILFYTIAATICMAVIIFCKLFSNILLNNIASSYFTINKCRYFFKQIRSLIILLLTFAKLILHFYISNALF
jgi:hypothetical protein